MFMIWCNVSWKKNIKKVRGNKIAVNQMALQFEPTCKGPQKSLTY